MPIPDSRRTSAPTSLTIITHTLFFTEWSEALLYTADGAGDGVSYSHYLFKDGKIDNLFGDDRWLHQPYRVESVARAYANATEAIGFKPLHHEGKVTGLAAFGRPTLYEKLACHFHVDEDAWVTIDFATASDMRDFILQLFKGEPRENVAASIQDVGDDLIHQSVTRLLERTPSAASRPRRRLVRQRETDRRFRRVGDADPDRVAALIDGGAAVAAFVGRMEFGPRALGARSILAAPTDRTINDSLYKRLARTEFMPFAPMVAEEDADDVFEIGPVNRYACRFMTITCAVRSAWQSRIPAVVHLDGTARPQVISRAAKPFFYVILAAYKRRTGIPVLINTSFNAHEEPVINARRETADALASDRIDYLATTSGLYARA